MRQLNMVLLLAPVSVFAASLGGPIAGYATFANGSELRAILGAPGSYRYSPPLPLPEGATRVHPAPARDFALVERAMTADFQETSPGLVTYSEGAIESFVPMPGAIAAPDWVAFSNEGGAAVLYSGQTNRLQAWSGLPASPQLVLDRTADGLGSPAICATLSEDAKTVLTASRSAIYLIPAAGAPKLLLSGGLIASVTMLRNGQDAAAADRATGAIQLLRAVDADATTSVLASGLEDVGAVYPSSDGTLLYAALPSAKAVAAIDLGSGAVNAFASGSGRQLNRLRNRDTFLIDSSPRQPAWVFFRDEAAQGGAAGSGKAVFIPALARSEEEQQ